MSRIITHPTRSETVQEMHLRIAVEEGGGIFVGMFDAEMRGIEPLVLFNSRSTGSTLALKVHDVNARTVRQHIAKQDALYHTFSENACKRVFSQFAQSEAD